MSAPFLDFRSHFGAPWWPFWILEVAFQAFQALQSCSHCSNAVIVVVQSLWRDVAGSAAFKPFLDPLKIGLIYQIFVSVSEFVSEFAIFFLNS